MEEESIFLSNRIPQAYIRLSLPVVMSMVVTLVYNLADTFFVARTGCTELVAGVSLGAPLFTFLMAIGNVLGQGGSVLVSRLLGQDDRQGIGRVSSFCFYATFVIGLVIAVLMLLLGLCPTLGVSGKFFNAIGMGLGVIFVLVCSNAVISLMKKIIPNQVRIPGYIVIIATFVTIVELMLRAFSPVLYSGLGIFIPLIVVNCIVLGRAEAFAGKNRLLPSVLDGLGMGIGFTLSLMLIAFIREILGAGTLTLWESGSTVYRFVIPGLSEAPVSVLATPAGALFVVGFVIAGINAVKQYRSRPGKDARKGASA